MSGPPEIETQRPARLAVNHATATLYLDETGIVAHPEDDYFGIGLLRACDAHQALRDLNHLCAGGGVTDELHWASFDKGASRGRDDRVDVAKAAIDLAFDSPGLSFSCLIADRQHGDIRARFKNHPHANYLAYEDVAARALRAELRPNELVTVLADEMSTPSDVHFERDVRNQVNNQLGHLAVVTVDRLDSRASPGLQLIDLLLGAATYDLRVSHPDETAQKRKISLHLLHRMNATSVRPGGRTDPNGRYRIELLHGRPKSRRGSRTRGGRSGR